ncbi:MAG: hypothetical protein AB1414_15110 [bacterium]
MVSEQWLVGNGQLKEKRSCLQGVGTKEDENGLDGWMVQVKSG